MKLVKIKIISIGLILSSVFVVFSIYLTHQYTEKTKEQRLDNLKQTVQIARNSIEPILVEYRSQNISMAETLYQIRDLVRRMVYDDHYGKNYIFMSAYDGTMLVQPFEPQKEMADTWDLKDSHGVYIIRELVKTAKSNEGLGFVSYHYQRPGQTDPEEKISFVIGIPDLGCYIGTGQYLSDLHRYQRIYTAKIVGSIIILLILIFLLTQASMKEINKQNIIIHKENEFLKLTEKALQSSESKYRRLSENSPAIVYQFKMDSDGAFSFPYINTSVKSIMGVAAEDIMQDSSKFLGMVISEDQKMFLEGVLKSAESLELYHAVIRYLKDGEERWIEARSTPDTMEDGSVVWDGFLIDITDKKNAEKERDAFETRLRQSQKMESIGTLAGGIAHDFNNILYPIIGFAEMLKEDLPPGSSENENAREIFNAGKRGGELVKQILAFSRQTEHKLLPVRFQNTLTEVLKLTCSTIPSNIEIHQEIQKDCGLVMADATQLHQIAMNLITNAYHAVEKANGGIFIQLKEVKLTNDELKNSHLKPGQYVMLSVSDNGIGIPRDCINKIFEPYFTTKETGKGTGLGLSVVYGILTEHKGDIKVSSEVGKGTTFKVYLPLMKKSTEASSTENVFNKQAGTESILLVDDEESVVRLEKQMLERLGYHVTARCNSLEALETFNSNPDGYDLVISDMTMPNMTGDQLAQKLMSIRSDIPIIICTGFSERINKEQAEVHKVKGFLMKPVTKSEMAEMVRKVLDEAKVS